MLEQSTGPGLGGRAHAKGLEFTTVVLGDERSYPLVELMFQDDGIAGSAPVDFAPVE
jgi:hypothetical protein